MSGRRGYAAMNLMMDAAKHILGRSISNQYGATIGRIVGILTDVRSQVTSVEVELGNGQFLNCPSSRLVVDERGIKLLDDWKLEADNLRTEFELAVKRMQALSDLHRQGDIQPDIYEDFHRNHDSNLNELETRRENLTKKLSLVDAELDHQIRELEMFLATNKMQLASGEIDPQAYKIAVDSIENGLDRAFSAKRDIEQISINIASLRRSSADRRLQQSSMSDIVLETNALNTGKLLPVKFTGMSSL
jgi:hypothetical protein